MLRGRWPIASRAAVALCTAFLCARAAAQDSFDREKSARDYVQFLVLQLDQWSTEFPKQFYAAMMKPPIDSSKLSEGAKSGPAELGESIKRLAALSMAPDLVTNAAFRSQLEKTLAATQEMNQAMSVQRFPALLQNSWDQIRSTLNNLARVYKLDMIAVLDPPASGGGRGGRGAPAAPATGPVPGGLAGYIVDLSCARRGKGMWANAECVARCVRDGDKLVLVTDDGKVYQIANQDKITPESYGQVVTLTGKTNGDTITVENLKM
ncbi:MAG TPA: hypothetical protein VMJ75_18265 [Candidatus Acidoferrales bacterium]|nr:hypothetical protein [Candidatus Acidoferrales bacterium]